MQEQHTSFLDGLAPDEAALILLDLDRRHFPAGTTIVAEGDSLHELYIIHSGRVDVVIADGSGGTLAVNQLGPGAVLGEMSLFTSQPASATARAADEVVVSILREADFERLAAAYPRLYRNVGAMLAEKLARSDRRALRHERGQVTLLLDHGAPPLLGYALACSIAWHTRRPTLLVVNDVDVPPDLAAIAAPIDASPRPRRPDPGAHALIARLDHGDLVPLLSDLRQRYDHVLVQVAARSTIPLPAARCVALAGPATSLSIGGASPADHTIRGWMDDQGAARPNHAGVVHVPRLSAADDRALLGGLLSAQTPAGRALGWSARHLSGLKVGLTLGAGGTLGYAHIGVWHALERLGLTPDVITGTSIGAGVAALFALGYSPDTAAGLMDRIGDAAWRMAVPTTGLLSNAGLRDQLRRFAGDRRIEDLDLPLAVVATDIVTRSEVVFRRGLLRQATLASMSIPGVFPPVRMGPYTLVDGAVLNPVPTDVAAALGADVVIAVKLTRRPSPLAVEGDAGESSGRAPLLIQTILASIDLMQSKINAQMAAAATIQIEPALADIPDPGLRHFRQARRYIAAGERAAEAALPRLATALPWLQDWVTAR